MEKPRLMAVVLLLIIIIFAFFILVTMELLTKFNFFIKMLVYLIFFLLAAFTIKATFGKNKVISNSNKINSAEFFHKIKSILILASTVQKIVLVFLLFLDFIFLAPTILIVVSTVGEIIFPRDTTGLAYLGFIYAPIGAILSWLCLISTKSYINRLNISKGKK